MTSGTRDEKTQKLLDMKPGIEETKSDSSLDSDDLRVSGDEELLDDLNGSLSSSEFDQEIKDKVKKHNQTNPIDNLLGKNRDDSDFDSDLEDIDLKSAFEFYDSMTPIEKLKAITAKARRLKERMD